MEEAEDYFISSLEKWRDAMKINQPITIMGHSFGAYLSSLYCLQHPNAVHHLILADP